MPEISVDSHGSTIEREVVMRNSPRRSFVAPRPRSASDSRRRPRRSDSRRRPTPLTALTGSQVAAGGSFHAAVAPRTEFRDWTRAGAGAVAAFVGFRRREDRWGC